MKKKVKKSFCVAVGMLIVFVLWTVAVKFVDVRAIGPNSTEVGFATINKYIHNLTGVNMTLYTITDWLGLVPFAFVIGFGLSGLRQWIARKNILKVDYSIFVLGGFYIVVMAAYIFFEMFVINYRPILINNCLEASYPSSTTMLVLCVMPTALMELKSRIKNTVLRRCVTIAIFGFTAFMVIGRLLSGVHWITDIIGGAMLSTGLVMLYYSVSNIKPQ